MMKNCVLKPSVDTVKWFKKTAIRCVRTFAATVVSLLPTTAATLGSVNWQLTFSSAALATRFTEKDRGAPKALQEERDHNRNCGMPTDESGAGRVICQRTNQAGEHCHECKRFKLFIHAPVGSSVRLLPDHGHRWRWKDLRRCVQQCQEDLQ